MTKLKTTSLSEQITKVSATGDIDKLITLIEQLKNPIDCSEALRLASFSGNAECAKLLIPMSDSKANSYALRLASLKGHIECVKLLIFVSDPKDENSESLIFAAMNNHKECVKLLLPCSDISKWGCGHWESIDSDMRNAIQSYYSKISLEQSLVENVLPNNNQISKNKKSHKI